MPSIVASESCVNPKRFFILFSDEKIPVYWIILKIVSDVALVSKFIKANPNYTGISNDGE